VSPFDGLSRIEPTHRELPLPPVRERYLDQPDRQREERRRRKRERPEQPEETLSDGEHIDVRA
jgi:hypothetical protein